MRRIYGYQIGTLSEYATEQGVSTQALHYAIKHDIKPGATASAFQRGSDLVIAWKSAGTWLVAIRPINFLASPVLLGLLTDLERLRALRVPND